ncbi:acyltransferase family protein [Derxia lacustris]|uniref:acyltransferase family protein n=1 Tax=Derxia lacustris TaxID=764842 RepID=UPI000A16FCBA|nr:acyltransferase [Derxia lacustris]
MNSKPLPRNATLDGVQILRFAAALAVVIHHAIEECLPLFGAAAPPVWLTLLGAAGVDVFFAISGFIMVHTGWAQFGAPGAGGRFLLRRALRVYPLYWLVTGAILLLHASGLAFRSIDANGWNLAASFSLLPLGNPVLGVAWTLVFEIYFYCVFALWIGLGNRRAAMAGIGISLLTVFAIARAIGGAAGVAPWSVLASPMPLEFAFGMAVALLWRVAPAAEPGVSAPDAPAAGMFTGRPARSWLLLPALAALALAAAMLPADGTAGLLPGARVWGWGLPAALALWAGLAIAPRRRPLGRALVALGDASYALYLSHPFVMIAAAVAVKRAGSGAGRPALAWAAVAVLAAASVALGWVVHRAVERRLARWLKPRATGLPPAPRASGRPA